MGSSSSRTWTRDATSNFCSLYLKSRETEIFHVSVHGPCCPQEPGLDQLKPGAQNATRSPWGWQGPNCLTETGVSATRGAELRTPSPPSEGLLEAVRQELPRPGQHALWAARAAGRGAHPTPTLAPSGGWRGSRAHYGPGTGPVTLIPLHLLGCWGGTHLPTSCKAAWESEFSSIFPWGAMGH